MTTTPLIPRVSSGRTTLDAESVPIAVTVVIPYLSREQHLQNALAGWFDQDYSGHLGVVVVDFSDKPSLVDLNRVRLIRSQSARWNINRARNIGARGALGDLLIFSNTDLVPESNFASGLVAQWDQFELWICDGLYRDIPHDPSLAGLIAVKRWVNTRLRGFNEEMMEQPHGWGYDAVDYRLRATAMLSGCGGSVGEYPGSSVLVLPHSDSARAEPYECDNLDISYDRHAAYSRWYRSQFGFIANIGADWGQQW